MGRILLKRVSRFKPSVSGGDTWSVTQWFHDTDTYEDRRVTSDEFSDPGSFTAPSTERAGYYCRHTTRVDVFHVAALDGTSRLETAIDTVLCELPPVPPFNPPPTGAVGLNNDPQAPKGAKLLKRQCKPANPVGFTYTDKYYDFQTRTIVSLNSPPDYIAETCTAFTFPAGDTIDKFCTEPGVAPFIERQYFWDGLNTLDFRDVEGVTACQLPPCTLVLTATATQPGINGLGSVVLSVTGAQGGVTYERVGAVERMGTRTTEVDLPPGQYTFKATETRENGCVAFATVTLAAVYGVRYQLDSRDRYDRVNSLLFRERGYTGPVEYVEYGQANVCTFEWPGSPGDYAHTQQLRGSECEMNLFITYEGQFLDTFSGDERLYQVEQRIEDALFWRGWLLPEQYTVSHLAPPKEFNLRATDGLGALDGLDFTGPLSEALTGQWTILQVIQHCLGRIGLGLPLYVLCSVYPQGASVLSNPLEQVQVDVASYTDSKLSPWSCGKVLQEVLASFGLRLMQSEGAWWLERVSELAVEARPYFAYAPDNTFTGIIQGGALLTITPPTSEPHWLLGTQTQGLLGAVRKVELEAKPEELVNLLAQQASLLPDSADSDGRPLGWTGTAPVLLLPNDKQKKPGTLLLTGAAPGTDPLAADFIQPPATAPVPTGVEPNFPLRLTFTATLRSAQPVPDGLAFSALPRFYFGLRHGDLWLSNGGSAGDGAQRLASVPFERVGESVTYTAAFGRYDPNDLLPRPATIRFLQMAAPASHARYDVEITNLTLTWNAPGAEENFIDFTVAESGLLVSRVDTPPAFFHTDTPGARLKGSLLDRLGFPTTLWFEAARPSQYAQLLAYLAAYRLDWQSRPVQTLTGDVRGDLRPTDLLTDPDENRVGVYALTSARYVAHAVQWSISAAQLRTLSAPGQEEAPAGALLWEDNSYMLSEDGTYLLTEDANA